MQYRHQRLSEAFPDHHPALSLLDECLHGGCSPFQHQLADWGRVHGGWSLSLLGNGMKSLLSGREGDPGLTLLDLALALWPSANMKLECAWRG